MQPTTSTRRNGLVLAALAQAATIGITWAVWQPRTTVPNLPVWEFLAGFSYGWLMLASLFVVVVWPRAGLVLHAAVFVIACLGDQFRLQPQFVGPFVLMCGCATDAGMRICRWYLVALWWWAGMHKLVSPEWFGPESWTLLSRAGPAFTAWHGAFVWVVPLGEILLGIAACLRPRAAAVPCVVLHGGIVLLLWAANWNTSVYPWNIGTAVIGSVILWHSEPGWPMLRWERVAAVVLTLSPFTFYLGWLDGGLAHALYSGNVPSGLITTRDGEREIFGWELAVPIPARPGLYRAYFDRVAAPGEKLHVRDPRPWLADQYFVKRPVGTEPIDVERFRSSGNGTLEVAGVELDDPCCVFALSRSGVRLLKRTAEGMIYAAEFFPDRFDPRQLNLLAGLPNLEQLQFAGCPFTDADLQQVQPLRNLRALGLRDTAVTADGLAYVRSWGTLTAIESDEEVDSSR